MMPNTASSISRRSLLGAASAAVLLSGCSSAGSGSGPAASTAATAAKTGHAEGSESVTFPSDSVKSAETLGFSRRAYEAAREPKELMVIPGASHFDLYDRPEHVEPAVERMAGFFGEHLA